MPDFISVNVDYGQDKSKGITVYTAKYTPDGNYIIFTATDGKLRFLNTTTYNIDYTYDNGYGELAISNDGSMLAYKTGVSGQAVQIMNPQTKEIIYTIPGSASGISGLAFSPDNKYLAVAYGALGKILKILEIQTGNNIYNYIENPPTYFDDIDWSNNGLYIAGADGQILYLYSTIWTFVPNDSIEKKSIIYPNPTDNTITIQFYLPKSSLTSINIYSESGNKIKILFEGYLEQGNNNVKKNISDLPSGIYTIQVISKDFSKIFKLIINK